MTLTHKYCANHPDRAGSALCMTCRRPICPECATRWDGINYCVQCLADRRGKATTRSSGIGWVTSTIAILLLLWIATRLRVWVPVMFSELF